MATRGRPRPWLSREVEELRRLWPLVRARQLSSDAAASRLGRTRRQVWSAASRLGLHRPRPRLAEYRVRLSGLARRGLTDGEISARLGVARRTVTAWRAALGLAPSPPESRAAAKARGVRAAARAAGADGVGRLAATVRLRRYAERGYPFGVRCPSQARAVDLCRAAGGVAMPDLWPAALAAKKNAYRCLDLLAGMGVLVRTGERVYCPRRRLSGWLYRLRSDCPGAARDVGYHTDEFWRRATA